MQADRLGVLTGVHFIDGDHACAEGALAAGCRFAAGYPITPSTEVVERLASRFPLVGGLFVQMEDEIASSIAIQGAVWAGAKAITVSSGPGISLMAEHIGYAAMTETPCVFVNVQRGGPSTGLPTLPGQADVMQARWGSHGDYGIIALSPNSPQEAFDLTVTAFNLSERFRCPVVMLLDECIGHMLEKVVIPPAEEIEVVPRRLTTRPPGEYLPFQPGPDGVPEMVKAGMGHRFHMTGLTHDERGYPVMTAAAQDALVRRLVDKVARASREIALTEARDLDDAQVAVVSYGITSRVVVRAAELARAKGIKVGTLRLKTIWPFPEHRVEELLQTGVRGLVMPELNLGQLVLELERVARGRARVVRVPHAGGTVHDAETIVRAIEEAAK
ncbi:MAG: 2-oxoacid:acceptor oxidoreductase subunit alpha [Myxococcales bacterium]|nr:2-oxoacid:acceptor oxidoreductase subunit alpha [Myxococcales bacterium]